MGDAQFEATIADIPMDDAQRAELVQLNSDARIQSTITSYVVAAVLILLGLLSTRWITIFKKDEDGKEELLASKFSFCAAFSNRTVAVVPIALTS